MRPKEGTVRRAGSVAASVRFSGVHYQEIAADPTDHLEGVGPMRGRSPQVRSPIPSPLAKEGSSWVFEALQSGTGGGCESPLGRPRP